MCLTENRPFLGKAGCEFFFAASEENRKIEDVLHDARLLVVRLLGEEAVVLNACASAGSDTITNNARISFFNIDSLLRRVQKARAFDFSGGEESDERLQPLSLRGHFFRGRRELLGGRRVALRDLIDLRERLIDLRDAQRLFFR